VLSPLITVFTPAFNRRHTLPRVFQALQEQTFTQFEWLVVDDGSTDGTKEAVLGWMGYSHFPLRYFYQENSGKHMAWNRAVLEASGKYFIVLDSDDSCVPEALERFFNAWEKVETPKSYAAVIALCKTKNGLVHGSRFPKHLSDHLTMSLRYRMFGEKWECWRTEVLRAFPFPSGIRGAFPESYVMNRIARQYQCVYINEALRIYHEDEPSLTRLSDPSRNSQGQVMVHSDFLNHYLDKFFWNPFVFFLAAIKFVRHSFHLKNGPIHQWKSLRGNARFIWIFALIPGWFVFNREKIGRKNLSGSSGAFRT